MAPGFRLPSKYQLSSVKYRRRLAFEMLALFVVLMTAIAWLYDFERAREQALEKARIDAEIQSLALTATLDRFRGLPSLWSSDTRTAAMIRSQGGLGAPTLDWLYQTGSFAVGVFDSSGQVVDWQDRQSGALRPERLVGQLLSQTRQGRLGRYKTTGSDGRPLYWFASAVRDGGYVGSVVVVVDLSELQQQWVIANHPLAVIDSMSEILLTNEPTWLGREFESVLTASEYARGWVVHYEQFEY